MLGLLAMLVVLPFGSSMVVSVLIGAVTCLITNGLLAFIVYKPYSANKPEQMLRRFYGGEVVKLVAISSILTAVFTTLDGLNVSALLAAYLVIQVASTVIAAQIKYRPETRQIPTTRIER